MAEEQQMEQIDPVGILGQPGTVIARSDGTIEPPIIEPKKSWGKMIIYAIIIVLIVVLLIWVYKQYIEKESFDTSKESQLGKALADRGWKLYTRKGCGYCDKQMKVLGGSYPKMIDCAGNNKCDGIRAFPTWVNENKPAMMIEGFQTLETLNRWLE